GDGLARLGSKPLDQLVRGAAGDLEVRVERDAALLERERKALEERACPRFDERSRGLDLRGGREGAQDLLPERGLHLELELGPEPRLDVGAQLGDRLELARRAGELVVERRED